MRIPRKDPLSEKKLQGEGALSKKKIVLGWEINTRNFSVHLPTHKFIAWSKDLSMIIQRKSTKFDEIKTINGRLTHLATILFPGRFFLNSLRDLERRCSRHGPQHLANEETNDISLWLEFLEHSTVQGVSISNITFTPPDSTCFSDACEHDLPTPSKYHQISMAYFILIYWNSWLHISLYHWY